MGHVTGRSRWLTGAALMLMLALGSQAKLGRAEARADGYIEWPQLCALIQQGECEGLPRSAPAHSPGYIESLKGTPQHYVLVRKGRCFRPRVLMPLQTGDWIYFLQGEGEPAGQVVLNLDGESKEIARKETPYRVGHPGQPRTVVSNLMHWVSGLAGRSEEESGTVQAVVRGDGPLELPLFAYEGTQVVAGRETLALAWLGGKPPYTAAIVGAEGVVAELEDLQRTRAVLGVHGGLTAGAYEVVVSDRTGTVAAAVVNAVPESVLPEPPSGLGLEPEGGSGGSPAGTVVYAAWLATQDRGQWGFEAYQRLAALSPGYEPARDLTFHLETVKPEVRIERLSDQAR